MPNITEKEFENLARLILETAGIQLDKGKEYLMEARMEPILERHGLDTYNDLYNQAISDATGKLKASIVDAITINETYFFRDNAPFDLLKNKVIPDIIDRKSTISPNRKIQLKIWSAACSTGQEVYSLGMMFREMRLNADRFEINILGTDISSEAVAKASYGKYNQFEIERGLSGHYLGKYFTKLANGWKIKDEIRSMARFSQMDLNKPFSGVGLFDVILCRNVAIYFPLSVKISLFQKLAAVLNPHGVLLVGGSESLAGLANDFVPRHYLNSVFYQLRKNDPDKPESPQLSPYRQVEAPPVPPKPRITPRAARPHRLKPNTPRPPDPIRPENSNTALQTGPPEQSKPPAVDYPGKTTTFFSEKSEKKSLLKSLQSQPGRARSPMIKRNSGGKKEKTSLLEKLNKDKKD